MSAQRDPLVRHNVCTCPTLASAEAGDCAIHAPRSAETCECGHPWFDHDSRGCRVDSFLTGACPCRLTQEQKR